MRFHCPKCDAKYRITEDKLAARPTARLRCKQCTTVFSVKEAIAAEALRPPSTTSDAELPAARSVMAELQESRTPLDELRPRKDAAPLNAPASPEAGPANAVPPLRPNPRAAPAIPRVPGGAPKPQPGASRPGVGPAARLNAPARPTPTGSHSPLAPRPAGNALGVRSPISAFGARPNLSRPLPGRGTGEGSLGRGEPPPSRPSVVDVPASRPSVVDVPASRPRVVDVPASRPSVVDVPASRPSRVDLPAPRLPPPGNVAQPVPPTPDSASETSHREPRPDAHMHRWASDPRHEGEALPSGEDESQEAAPASKTLPNLEQPLQGAEPQHAGVAAPPFRPARQELAGWAAPSPQPSSEASAPLVVASNYPLVEPSSGKRSMSISAALALALCFGLAGFALGYVLFSDQREEVAAGSAAPPTPCVNTEPRVAMGAAPPPPPPLEETVEAEAKASEAAVSAPTTGGKKGPVASGAAAKAGTSGEGNELLSGLGNIPGPIAGPAAGSGSSGAGLESSAIERTVQQYQSGVRRSCWQPALNNRALGAASSARVTATLRISPSGTVNSVSHSGDPSGYPGLANCIAARVKGWTFPKAAGPTTANIPFVFAAQ